MFPREFTRRARSAGFVTRSVCSPESVPGWVCDQMCVPRECTRWARGAGFVTRCVFPESVPGCVCDQMCVFPESVPGGREVLGL